MRNRPVLALSRLALIACALASAPAALAADYPVLRGSQFEDAPPPRDIESVFTWSGFYAGGGVGYSRTRFEPGTLGLQTQVANLDASLRIAQNYRLGSSPTFRIGNDSGASYAGFAGYNMVFGDAMLGLELDYTRLNHDYQSSPQAVQLLSVSGAGPVVNSSVVSSQRLEDYASARLRFGYAWGRFMPFASLGVAAGRGTSTVAVAPDALGGSFSVRTRNSAMFGLTGGVGIDAALADNLFLRAEYLFTRFASFEDTVIDINNVRIGAGLKF